MTPLEVVVDVAIALVAVAAISYGLYRVAGWAPRRQKRAYAIGAALACRANRRVRAAGAFERCSSRVTLGTPGGLLRTRVISASMRILALAAIGALFAHPVFACSFMPGYEAFRVGPVLRPSMTPAPARAVGVESIERGYDDGDRASCSDAGVLVLKVSQDSVGYRFEIVAGSFGDGVFPDGYVRTRERGRLRFVWLDGEDEWQESIDVLLKITTLSATGVVSEPTLLRVRHSGGSSVRR